MNASLYLTCYVDGWVWHSLFYLPWSVRFSFLMDTCWWCRGSFQGTLFFTYFSLTLCYRIRFSNWELYILWQSLSDYMSYHVQAQSVHMCQPYEMTEPVEATFLSVHHWPGDWLCLWTWSYVDWSLLPHEDSLPCRKGLNKTVLHHISETISNFNLNCYVTQIWLHGYIITNGKTLPVNYSVMRLNILIYSLTMSSTLLIGNKFKTKLIFT